MLVHVHRTVVSVGRMMSIGFRDSPAAWLGWNYSADTMQVQRAACHKKCCGFSFGFAILRK